METLRRLFRETEAQDVAEYAIMMAVILVIVVGTVSAISTNSNVVFSGIASSLN